MRALIGLRRWRFLGLIAAGLATAGGVAYATIPDSGGAYTACMLTKAGTIRLIDPSLGNSSLLGHCTALETQIGWNQRGRDGVDGVSPTVTQLSTGDTHCAAGGAAITDARGTTAYVCSGANGHDGQPFAGTFTSPNGKFSLTVADGGVEIVGPDSKISLSSAGGVTVSSSGVVSVTGDELDTVANDANSSVAGDRIESVGGDVSTEIGGDRTEAVGGQDTLAVGGSRSASVGTAEALTVGGSRTETVSGNESITVQGSRNERVDKSDSLLIGTSRTETVGSNETVSIGGNRTEFVASSLSLQAAAAFSLTGHLVSINAGTSCTPAARVGDVVASPALVILTGSPTVCIG